MENNKSHEISAGASGWSSDTNAPASTSQGFYSSAGFGQATGSDPRPTGGDPSDHGDPSGHAERPDAGNGSENDDAGFNGWTGYAPPAAGTVPNGPRPLYRTDGPISGVAAGLADYFNVDVALVRIILIATTLVSFPVVPLAYIAAWMIIPRENAAPIAPIMTAPTPSSAPVDTVSSPVEYASGK